MWCDHEVVQMVCARDMMVMLIGMVRYDIIYVISYIVYFSVLY